MARVLVAEDEAPVRSFVVRALELSGHQVTEVADGAAAAEALRCSGDSEYDLLVTDIVMPVMDGIALALLVARDHRDCKVILMTGFAEQRERAEGLEALVHTVLQKPFSLEDLNQAVDAALAVAS